MTQKAKRELNWKSAIFELFLIVAGILIALYINNLNETNKEINFERKILFELKSSLTTDLNFHIKNRIQRSETIENSAEIILSFLDKKLSYHDSLNSHFWVLNWIMIFEPQTTAFETLKSKGIEILRNDATRKEILQLYDSSYPRISFFVNDFNQWTTNRSEPFFLKNFKIDFASKGKMYTPLNLSKLMTNIEFRNLVIEKISLSAQLSERMKRLEERVTKLINKL